MPSKIRSITLCILDGFLLYSDPANPSIPRTVTDLLDVKVFLRLDHERMKTRREARNGYVTLEGFWKDPDGYVDEIVWPNYVKEHRWMFHGGNVDQSSLSDSVRLQNILVAPGKGERSLTEILPWSVETIENEINRVLGA